MRNVVGVVRLWMNMSRIIVGVNFVIFVSGFSVYRNCFGDEVVILV